MQMADEALAWPLEQRHLALPQGPAGGQAACLQVFTPASTMTCAVLTSVGGDPH